MLLPRTPAPALECATLDGHFNLASHTPGRFTLIIVYRGLHCPLCRDQLQEVCGLLGPLALLGVDVIAMSADSKERALEAQSLWQLGALTIGYDVAFSVAQAWGLYVSNARKPGEPERFFEPGLFLVRTDGELYFAQTQNMPFGRASLAKLPHWLKKCIDNEVPARGEVDLATLA
ncbi:MAG: redoxin domain-containing protein [Pseudomonadota bacterium]